LPTFPIYHKSQQLFIMSYNTRASGHACSILNGKDSQGKLSAVETSLTPKTENKLEK